MNESIWDKVIIGITAFVFTSLAGMIVGGRIARAKYEEKVDGFEDKINSLEKLITASFEYMQKLSEQQAISMGREIGELKDEVKTLRQELFDLKGKRK